MLGICSEREKIYTIFAFQSCEYKRRRQENHKKNTETVTHQLREKSLLT
jgi:hypothetical protein